jgi:hypothetical protein
MPIGRRRQGRVVIQIPQNSGPSLTVKAENFTTEYIFVTYINRKHYKVKI